MRLLAYLYRKAAQADALWGHAVSPKATAC